jgi:transcriptional regulator with XRE-family HTH domain
MDREELRVSLGNMRLSQTDFSALLGVTTRAVSLWMSGERPVPGPATAYLRLYAAAPEGVRIAELERLDRRTTEMREGMYALGYESHNEAGMVGAGFGTAVFEGGRVYGADPFGAKYDGEYAFNPASGMVDVRLKIAFPANSPAVFGVSYPHEWAVDVTATIDPLLDEGTTHFTPPVGTPVNVGYRFLRSLPG